MKRTITLYIGGRRADLDDDTFVVFNFRRGDMDNPTAVRNSWSNSVTLPGTPSNNKLFGDIFRTDRRVASGNWSPAGAYFDPSVRTAFAIYADTGEILVNGYCKLEKVNIKNGTPSYDVSLFGGLGSLIYGLSYDGDGNALTLAALDYLQTGDPDTELDFIINRDAVLSAWQDLTDLSNADIFGVVNFAPAYNGAPGGDFAANKCLFDLDCYEYEAPGQTVATLSKDYTEREMGDFRSYLQRPVIRVGAVLDAIVRYASTLGHTLTVSQAVAQSQFITDTWMTLPVLKDKRSGDAVSKADLLGGTCSPASFLLGLVKSFGLMLVPDGEGFELIRRDDFYAYGGDTIDLTGRIDISQALDLDPLHMDAKWYEFSSEDEGDFATAYKERRGQIYGSRRLNTGYDFDASVKQVVEKVPFRGAVQSREFSGAFRTITATIARSGSPAYTRTIPAPFLDGGTYDVPSSLGGQTGKPLTTGVFSAAWWDAQLPGYDTADMAQLHGADNKAIDGGGVLLFYTGQPATASGAVISDDAPGMGEAPCWNRSSVNTTALAVLPHFTRFLLNQAGRIIRSLDWGPAAETNVPGLFYASENVGLYADFWRDYLHDRYDVDTKVLRCRVDFRGISVGHALLRRFAYWNGSLWSINAIEENSMTTFDPASVELVQVQDMEHYINGQI